MRIRTRSFSPVALLGKLGIFCVFVLGTSRRGGTITGGSYGLSRDRHGENELD